MWDLVPWSGIEPRPPALKARTLSHRKTREVSVLNFESYLYIKDTSLLSNKHFADIFPQSLPCLLIFFTGSFSEQILKFWWSSIYQVFFLWTVFLGVKFKNLLSSPRYPRFPPISPCPHKVLFFTFMSMIHLELILYNMWVFRQASLFLVCGFPTAQPHLLRRQSFIYWIVWHLCEKSFGHIYVWVYFWVLYSHPFLSLGLISQSLH